MGALGSRRAAAELPQQAQKRACGIHISLRLPLTGPRSRRMFSPTRPYVDASDFLTDVVSTLASHRLLEQQREAEERVKAETGRRQARQARAPIPAKECMSRCHKQKAAAVVASHHFLRACLYFWRRSGASSRLCPTS